MDELEGAPLEVLRVLLFDIADVLRDEFVEVLGVLVRLLFDLT